MALQKCGGIIAGKSTLTNEADIGITRISCRILRNWNKEGFVQFVQKKKRGKQHNET